MYGIVAIDMRAGRADVHLCGGFPTMPYHYRTYAAAHADATTWNRDIAPMLCAYSVVPLPYAGA